MMMNWKTNVIEKERLVLWTRLTILLAEDADALMEMSTFALINTHHPAHRANRGAGVAVRLNAEH